MRKNLKAKTLESLSSVLPITALVLLLSFTLAPDMPVGTLMMFLLGAILLVVGMGLFSLGADMAMMPMGDSVGGEVVRLGKRSVWPILPIVFLIGAFITMAEPDLQVLANQVPAVPDMVIILTVAAGVGVFLVISVVNTLKEKFSLNSLLLFFYILVFLLAFIVPGEFLAVAFDSGGVTTGPMTVPFIMALGVGVASIRSDEKAKSDSFGLVALCSIGPILAVLLLLSVAVYRPFCRYLCPLGAVYGLFNPIAFYRFRVDGQKCTGCAVCQKACPMDIPVYKTPNSPECIRCGVCRKSCPHGAICPTLSKNRVKEAQ